MSSWRRSGKSRWSSGDGGTWGRRSDGGGRGRWTWVTARWSLNAAEQTEDMEAGGRGSWVCWGWLSECIAPPEGKEKESWFIPNTRVTPLTHQKSLFFNLMLLIVLLDKKKKLGCPQRSDWERKAVRCTFGRSLLILATSSFVTDETLVLSETL